MCAATLPYRSRNVAYVGTAEAPVTVSNYGCRLYKGIRSGPDFPLYTPERHAPPDHGWFHGIAAIETALQLKFLKASTTPLICYFCDDHDGLKFRSSPCPEQAYC